jgi:NADH:ubiquinone oxidoreductase subunit
MKFLLRLLTWWNGQTLGTQLFTWRKGVLVGEDAQGNAFYQTKDGKRRWVIFNGESEASRVSPDWHGWLHFTWDEPPTKVASEAQALGKAASGKPDRYGDGLCARRARSVSAQIRSSVRTTKPGRQIRAEADG